MDKRVALADEANRKFFLLKEKTYFLLKAAVSQKYAPKACQALITKYKIEEIERLLQFGADYNKKNNEGISPKKLAELNKQRKILHGISGI